MRVRSGPVDCCASVALPLEVKYMLLYSVTECLDTRQRQADENWSLFVNITIKKHIIACLQNAHLQSYSNWYYVDLPQCCKELIFCNISEPTPVTTCLVSLPSPFTRTAQCGSQFAPLQISVDASNQE